MTFDDIYERSVANCAGCWVLDAVGYSVLLICVRSTGAMRIVRLVSGVCGPCPLGIA